MLGNNSSETTPGNGKNVDYLKRGLPGGLEVEGVGWKLIDEVQLCFLWAVCAWAQRCHGYVRGNP